MTMPSITLRDLEYLVAVAEHSHFGKAARAVNVSQPTLSGQTRKLEDILGVTLFERTNRSVVITEAGRRLAAQARVVLEEAQKLTDLAHSPTAPLTGSLKLGAIATLGPYYLPHVLGPLHKAFPSLDLHLREGQTSELISDLRGGALDAVLASPTFPTDGLQLFPLFFEPFLLLTPKGHPLSTRDPLRSLDLRASEMVLLEDGHCLKDQALQVCPKNRRGNLHQYQATSIETLKQLVATGHGYTLIPHLAATPDKRLKDLIRYRPFPDKSVGREIVLVCRKRFGRIEDINALARFLKTTSGMSFGIPVT
jgi:LysR family hydrogen peroxide-inducible transcriptional activator